MTLLNDLKKEIRDEWKQFFLAIIGSVLLLVGYILCLAHETGWSAAFTIAGGVIDLFIVWQKMRTITSWLRGQFKKWLDRTILAAKLGLMAYFVLCKWQAPITKYDVLLCSAICIIAWHLWSNEAGE